uniref:Uncharacterized protein n=1 Tax=Romanomermis culicivorax TaxID=13658 RepID=A0A915JH38_ROMCU
MLTNGPILTTLSTVANFETSKMNATSFFDTDTKPLMANKTTNVRMDSTVKSTINQQETTVSGAIPLIHKLSTAVMNATSPIKLEKSKMKTKSIRQLTSSKKRLKLLVKHKREEQNLLTQLQPIQGPGPGPTTNMTTTSFHKTSIPKQTSDNEMAPSLPQKLEPGLHVYGAAAAMEKMIIRQLSQQSVTASFSSTLIKTRITLKNTVQSSSVDQNETLNRLRPIIGTTSAVQVGISDSQKSMSMQNNNATIIDKSTTKMRSQSINPQTKSPRAAQILSINNSQSDGKQRVAEQNLFDTALADVYQRSDALLLSKRDMDFLKKASTSPEIFSNWSTEEKLRTFMLDDFEQTDFTLTLGMKDTLPVIFNMINKSLLGNIGHQLDEMLSCLWNDQQCDSRNTSPNRDPWYPQGYGLKLLQNQVQKPYFGYANTDMDPYLNHQIRICDA